MKALFISYKIQQAKYFSFNIEYIHVYLSNMHFLSMRISILESTMKQQFKIKQIIMVQSLNQYLDIPVLSHIIQMPTSNNFRIRIIQAK